MSSNDHEEFFDAKKVVLVGHCGADVSYLRIVLSKALTGAAISAVDESSDLKPLLDAGADLVLVNRQLDWGFDTDSGVELIRQLRGSYPKSKFMLVSNYPEAQHEAIAAGALRGFGKRDLRDPHVADLLKAAIE